MFLRRWYKEDRYSEINVYGISPREDGGLLLEGKRENDKRNAAE